jgi:hypothetical protein
MLIKLSVEINYNIIGVRGLEPLHLGIKNQRLCLLAILQLMTGNGIEPMYMDFQSTALPTKLSSHLKMPQTNATMYINLSQ